MKDLLLLAVFALAEDKPRPPILDPVLYDVVVIGGGAAEVTAAKRLAARGRRVILIDRGLTLGAKDLTSGACAERPYQRPLLGGDLIERLYGPTETIGRELKGGDLVKVRLRAQPRSVTAGEHLVSVRYHYQGLPRMVRARTVLMAWKGDAHLEVPIESRRVFTTSSLPGTAVLRGHCAAAQVLQRLADEWKPGDWPPCGPP